MVAKGSDTMDINIIFYSLIEMKPYESK